MRKFKYALVLALTVAVIAAGAILPVITAKVQDSAANRKISYGNMKEMRLDLHELSTLEKLYLISTGSIVDISEDKARLATKNIRQVVEKELQPYIQKGLIKDNLSKFSIESRPKLYYTIDSTEISNIFWLVTMSYGDNDDNWEKMEFCVDDKTGKIMTISYDCAQPIYEDWSWNERLIDFYGIYFDRLDLKPDEGFQKTVDNVVSVLFNWGDIQYGEVMMEFYTHPAGFTNWVLNDEERIENSDKVG